MNESGNLSRADLYDRLRSQIQHEDNVINIRVVWQLLGQSFFFSTYAAVLNSKGEAKNVLFQQQQELLLWAVPIAALIAGLLASMSIFSSLYTIEHLGNVSTTAIQTTRTRALNRFHRSGAPKRHVYGLWSLRSDFLFSSSSFGRSSCQD